MKASHCQLLRPEWVTKSFIEDEDCRQSLKVWLIDGNYYANCTPPDLSLNCLDTEELMRSLSLDAFRLSAHAAQTICEVEKTSAYSKFSSWRIIQVYYAAFFAAHATLKFFGSSFSHLEAGHAEHLKQVCLKHAGYTPSIQASNYLIQFDPQSRTVRFSRYGESHKDLWKCYLHLISDLEKATLKLRASNMVRQEISAYFADLGMALTDRGRFQSGNWLSSIRNDVNYQSSPSAWFPFSKGTPAFEDLLRRARGWQAGQLLLENPNAERNNLVRFFITAFSVVDFCVAISKDYKILVGGEGIRSQTYSKILNLGLAA